VSSFPPDFAIRPGQPIENLPECRQSVTSVTGRPAHGHRDGDIPEPRVV